MASAVEGGDGLLFTVVLFLSGLPFMYDVIFPLKFEQIHL
jgi:hypothetical protein